MKAVVAGANTALVGQYIQDKTGCQFDPGMFQAMAILDDEGTFCGGVVFSEFRGYDCQLSAAAETPLAWKDTVRRAVFAYVFNQLGCVRCTSITKKSNKRARSFLEGLGFVLEGRIRRGFDGVRDGLIYGMLREECAYIEGVRPDVGVQAEEDAAADPDPDTSGVQGSTTTAESQEGKPAVVDEFY